MRVVGNRVGEWRCVRMGHGCSGIALISSGEWIFTPVALPSTTLPLLQRSVVWEGSERLVFLKREKIEAVGWSSRMLSHGPLASVSERYLRKWKSQKLVPKKLSCLVSCLCTTPGGCDTAWYLLTSPHQDFSRLARLPLVSSAWSLSFSNSGAHSSCRRPLYVSTDNTVWHPETPNFRGLWTPDLGPCLPNQEAHDCRSWA